MEIRSYQPKDRECLRNICKATASEAYRGDPGREEFICLLFCDYYLDCEGESVFVAVDADDIPCGYILCSRHFWSFLARMLSVYMPRARAILPRGLGFYRAFLAANIPFAPRYPAHLHIDILDGHQRQGIGHALMDALVAHLRERRVKGLCLIVGRENEKGVNFYRSYGFRILFATKETAVMGLRMQARGGAPAGTSGKRPRGDGSRGLSIGHC